MEPGADRIVIFKLKPGWVFDVDAGVVKRRGQRVQLLLPPGARVRPALALPPAGRVRRSAAEREIERFVHLVPPRTMNDEAALALVRDWDFVEHAELASPTA